MVKIKLEYEEKRFLMQSLIKLASEMTKEQSEPDITEIEEEFFCTVLEAYDCRTQPCGLFAHLRSVQKVDLKQCMAEYIENIECPDEIEHPKETLEICLEFAYLYYFQRKPCNRNEFFDNLCDVFDLFPVKRKDYKDMIDMIEKRVERNGIYSLTEKYKTIISEKEMADGYFYVDVPEIYIPAYKIEVDMSDEDTLSDWEKIQEHLEELCDYIVKPIGKTTIDEICKPIDALVEQVSTQLNNAEEKYDELKDEEEED